MPEEPVKLDETLDAKPYEPPKPGRREIIRVASVIFVLLAVTGSFLGKCAMRQRRLAAEQREAAEKADRERAAEAVRQWGQRWEDRIKHDTLLSLRISSAAEHLNSEDVDLRKHGARELGEIGAEAQRMIGELTKLAAGDPDPEVRAAAASALKKIRGEETKR